MEALEEDLEQCTAHRHTLKEVGILNEMSF